MSKSPEQRLADLELTLPEVAAPVASYVPTVRSGSQIFVSGQLPWRDGELVATGKVGQDLDEQQAVECARHCALNGIAALKAELGELADIKRVVKLVVFVASGPGFTGQPAVANGASDLLGEVFGEAGRHARSAVGVAALPLDTPVEVELIVEV